MNIEVMEQLLGIVEYQLVYSRADLPKTYGKKRSFTVDEDETIAATLRYVRNTLHDKRMVELAEKYAEMERKDA